MAQSPTEIEAIIFDLLGFITHEMSHKVVSIKNCTYDLLEYFERYSKNLNLKRSIDLISRMTDELAVELRLMRSIRFGLKPEGCEFLCDILEPAMLFLSRYRVTRMPHLIVDPTMRAAPKIEVRTGPSIFGLFRLIGKIESQEIRCNAEFSGNSTIFRLIMQAPMPSLDVLLSTDVISILEYAGFFYTVEHASEDHTFCLIFKVKEVKLSHDPLH